MAESTNIVSSAPYYDLRFPNTDHILVACRDHPLQLYQALPPTPAAPGHAEAPDSPYLDSGWKLPLASYRLISPTTEAYLQVHSAVWPSPGTHFLVGTRDLIAQFDITRNGDGPSTQVPTIPSRRHIRKGNGIGMRGTVSALSVQTTAESIPTGLVAAGTWTRCVGLYDFARGGECTSTWNIEEASKSVTMTDPPPDSEGGNTRYPTKGIGGAGINQTVWSPCGRYLLINERQSTGMLIYDVRVTNKVLGFLAGRDALTHQRLNCDVFRGLDNVGGFEVWAGTRDGTVKVWEGVGNTEGCQWPSWDFPGGGGSGIDGTASTALGSVALHHSGSVIATCSGCWTIPDGEGDSKTDSGASSENESSDDSDDDISSISSTISSSSSMGPPNLRLDERRFEESTLKVWRIGPGAPSNEEGDLYESGPVETHEFGASEQVHMST